MKRSLITCLLLIAVVSLNAQNVRRMWVSMPDSLCRYLNQNLRLELVELKEMGVKAEVKNLLGGESVLDTLTEDFLSVTASKGLTLQLRRLPAEQDSVYCLLSTWSGPAKYSIADIYSKDWQRVSTQRFDDLQTKDLTVRPDTMSTARYEELLRVPDPKMVWATLSPADNSLEVSLSVDLATKEERQALEVIVSKRNLKWDKKRFK